jgi:hypothetical protein
VAGITTAALGNHKTVMKLTPRDMYQGKLNYLNDIKIPNQISNWVFGVGHHLVF